MNAVRGPLSGLIERNARVKRSDRLELPGKGALVQVRRRRTFCARFHHFRRIGGFLKAQRLEWLWPSRPSL
jgi:hypothetical protein